MIPANKDPKILIKEKDRYFWHVEQTRRDVKPGNDPTAVRTTTWVKVYRGVDYKRIFESKETVARRGGPRIKGGTNLLPAGGIREARLVHDPILQKQIEGREAEERKAMMRESAEKTMKVTDDLGADVPETGETGDDGGNARRPPVRKKKE
jgi:hypothetical protein